jgi:hypothetical protein
VGGRTTVHMIALPEEIPEVALRDGAVPAATP